MSTLFHCKGTFNDLFFQELFCFHKKTNMFLAQVILFLFFLKHTNKDFEVSCHPLRVLPNLDWAKACIDFTWAKCLASLQIYWKRFRISWSATGLKCHRETILSRAESRSRFRQPPAARPGWESPFYLKALFLCFQVLFFSFFCFQVPTTHHSRKRFPVLSSRWCVVGPHLRMWMTRLKSAFLHQNVRPREALNVLLYLFAIGANHSCTFAFFWRGRGVAFILSEPKFPPTYSPGWSLFVWFDSELDSVVSAFQNEERKV